VFQINKNRALDNVQKHNNCTKYSMIRGPPASILIRDLQHMKQQCYGHHIPLRIIKVRKYVRHNIRLKVTGFKRITAVIPVLLRGFIENVVQALAITLSFI
jgi:hypothetical protein